MSIQPYLIYAGRTEEAINFYKTAIGATQTALMRFKDAPMGDDPNAAEGCAGGPPPNGDAVIHASFSVNGSEVLCSDGMPGEASEFKGFSLTLQARDEAQAKQYFAALSNGGSVTMPLSPTFFSPCFGMLVDPFGVSWMVIVSDQ